MISAESQKGNPTTKRVPARLGAALDKSLLAYAAAAGAAGVSLLALAQPAEAKIVYTKANKEIAPGKGLFLDLDHNQGRDFKFAHHSATSRGSQTVTSLTISPLASNGVQSNAAVLASGAQIGPNEKFQTTPQLMAYRKVHFRTSSVTFTTVGAWKNITSGYLGLKFFIHGKAHYGWARLNVTVGVGIYALLTGYAYETVNNKAILAGKTKGNDSVAGLAASSSNSDPEPATLGLLARGAAGLATSRKRAADGK